MKIIRNNIIPFPGYKAIAILNLMFVRKNANISQLDINHEEIHWKQEKELLIIGFYILYILFFIIRLLCTLDWHEAYRSICFEREAYAYEDKIEDRKHYGWCKFLLRYGN